MLQSEFVLSRVVTDLKLDQEWGKRQAHGKPLKMEQAVAMLRARLHLRPVRNTSLVEICVSSDKPSEAAQIANAIAGGYKMHRMEQRRQASLGGVEVLEERFSKQQREIEEQEKKVSRLRQELQIPDAIVNADGPAFPAFLLSAETLRKIEAERIETQTDLIRQETMLNSLKQMKLEQLVQVLPTTVNDSLLITLLESQAMAEQSLVAKSKDFGAQHIEIIKLNEQIADLKKKIKLRVEGIMSSLDARVTASRKSLEGLHEEVQSATTKDIAAAQQSQRYYDAKHQLEQLQRFAQILTQKIASEKIDMDLPKTGMVEIVDQATAPIRPVSPNLYRAVSCCALGLLLAVIGIVMVKGALRRSYASAQPGRGRCGGLTPRSNLLESQRHREVLISERRFQLCALLTNRSGQSRSAAAPP